MTRPGGLAVMLAVGCSGATTGTARQSEDASLSTGGSGGMIGAGGVAGSTGGEGQIGSGGDAGSCSGPFVGNVTQGVTNVPSDGCTGISSSDPTCVGPPVTFSCPVVRGPGDSGTIHPGDQITVSVVAASDGFVNYPCFGLIADHGVVGGANFLYALPSTAWVFSVQIPLSLVPGTVVHFTVYVRSSSSLNSGPCPNRLGRLDFDVTVG